MDNHRLATGELFGLPVVLDTDSEDIAVGDRVLLSYQGQASCSCGVMGRWWGAAGAVVDGWLASCCCPAAV